MTTETLPPCTAIVTLGERRRASMLDRMLPALCTENNRVAAERDHLRSAIERAVHDLRAGWSAAAIDVLERAIDSDRSTDV